MRSHTTTSNRSPRASAASSTSRASVPENACVQAYPACPKWSASMPLMWASSSTMSTVALAVASVMLASFCTFSKEVFGYSASFPMV